MPATPTTTPHARFLALMEGHRRLLLKVCWAYGRSPHDRDDLLQEILARAWSAFGRYDPDRPFATWLYRVALNAAIDHQRSRRRWARVSVGLDEDPAGGPGLDPGAMEDAQALRELMDRLGDADRALLLLYLDGHAYREIGDILGMSESNVGTRLGRLKTTLRRSARDPSFTEGRE